MHMSAITTVVSGRLQGYQRDITITRVLSRMIKGRLIAIRIIGIRDPMIDIDYDFFCFLILSLFYSKIISGLFWFDYLVCLCLLASYLLYDTYQSANELIEYLRL